MSRSDRYAELCLLRGGKPTGNRPWGGFPRVSFQGTLSGVGSKRAKGNHWFWGLGKKEATHFGVGKPEKKKKKKKKTEKKGTLF